MVASIYFVNFSPFNVFAAEDNRISYVTALDGFDGRHPRVFFPGDVPDEALADISTATSFLMQHPAVVEHLQQSDRSKLLFLMFDERAEQAAQRAGIEILHPSAALRRRLDCKIEATRLAERAGVLAVPNVLAHIDSYADLRRVAANLGPDLVVQTSFGDSGSTTFFISCEQDFDLHAEQIASAPEAKIMRRIRCQPAALEGCVTRLGVLAGPLQTELVGFSELTPYRGGWCGNELRSDDFSMEIRRQARTAAEAIGREMGREGYRGVFGIDFLIDLDDGRLYFGELNPRITGAAPIADLAAREQGCLPLLTRHLAEWLNEETSFDASSMNEYWMNPASATGWSQMIIDHLGANQRLIAAPPSGLWRMADDGSISFIRSEIHPSTVGRSHEALFLRTLDVGRSARTGAMLGRLITRDPLVTQGQLSTTARDWNSAFRALYQFGE